MQSALYEGVVSHRRQTPTAHEFQYPLFMLYLNLDELEEFFALSPLWSLERFNWASFYRRDFMNPSVASLRDAVRLEIRQQTGHNFNGEIFLLTHIRYLGYCFNPVSFYYCFEQGKLIWIVAEINNTPWNERFRYVLQCDAEEKKQTFAFDKAFHVSPFLPMGMQYEWQFSTPGEKLSVFMRNRQDGVEVVNATLLLQRQDFTASALNRVLLRFPAVTVKTVAGIYWQALRLWLKRTPIYDHPLSDEATPHAILNSRQSNTTDQH
ncbi:MAG: DUF1365 domain-containing protein [Gammaproteobacteria bacterium]|nr:DUF1365 domain-containing protein [Gammaproteobacteria bacterium]